MDGEWVRWLLGLAGLILMSVFGEMLRRLFNKVDALDEKKANVVSTDNRFADVLNRIDQQGQRFEQHQTEDKNMHRDVLQELRETNRHLSMTNATLANLSGRFDATNGRELVK